MAAVNNDPVVPVPISLDPTDPTSPYYDPTLINPILTTNPIQAVVEAEIKADDEYKANNVKSRVRRLRALEQQSPNIIELQNELKNQNRVNKKGV
jgi:hypothetical protein